MIYQYQIFKKVKKKGMDRSNKKILKYYINAQQQIPVSYGSMLHISPINLLLLAAKQDHTKTVLTKNIEDFFWEKFWRTGQRAEKKKGSDRKSNRTRQKNVRGDSKVESNDSPEIPDRGETSDIPGLPSGEERERERERERETER